VRQFPIFGEAGSVRAFDVLGDERERAIGCFPCAEDPITVVALRLVRIALATEAIVNEINIL
jgi:hypothetical protein